MAFSKKPMRRSQLISPWGVGAIVPFPDDESLMIAGLDMWRYNSTDGFLIKDERLQRRLGVKELRWPPDFRDQKTDARNYNLKIPAVKFPRWHYCPFCGTMQKLTYYTNAAYCDGYPWPHGRSCASKKKFGRRLIPERFVVVCPDGHIDDFPVAEWLHQDGEHSYDPSKCHIRRSTGGTSASLTGVFYECSCGAKRSIAGATRPGALKKIGYRCRGARPWLGVEKDDDSPCDRDDVKVLQRGATNVWFADTRSSIHIPTDDESPSRRIVGILDQFLDPLRSHRINGELNRDFIRMLAEANFVNADDLYAAAVKRLVNIECLPEITEDMSEDDYRLAEYKVLIKSSGGDTLDFHSINYPISVYDPVLHKYFRSISLVPKLRETRAFVGFSRLEPSIMDISQRKRMLRLGNGGWLPAIEVYGEGIFFEFNADMLKQFAERTGVQDRSEKLDRAYHASSFGKHASGRLRPEFVLIHTFSHLLINQLGFECGYGSSSIRERIYCEKTSNDHEMYGLLLYTASGDSEGSLGGLVRQGEKGRIEDTIMSALKNAAWCSSDPICIQSKGQGPESCNLSACHNCALLPETCCECGNRLLDRGVVVGTLAEPELAFFDNARIQ